MDSLNLPNNLEASTKQLTVYNGLQWIQSEEGLVAIDPIIDDIERRWERAVRYRLKRDASLSRDNPPRLPCRPYENNGEQYGYEDTRSYHQPRVCQEEMDPKWDTKNEDTCYTCMNHRLCKGPVCEATVMRCAYCDSEKGPLRVRRNDEKGALARKLDWECYKLKLSVFYK